MNKKIYLILLVILLITSTLTTVIASNDTKKLENMVDDKINKIKTFIGLEKEDNNEPENMFDEVIIEVYGYEQLKEEISKCPKNENKSYTFNLNDGDYNITGMITCGDPHNNAQFIINGNGHTIDGQNKYQFMKLYSNLKLKDLTIQNTAYDNFNTSSVITMETVSDLYIKNCVFLNNHGKTKGSVITNRGTCYVIKSTFINNSVEEVGGAIWSTGEYGGCLTIKDSLFEKNYANSQDNNERTAIVYMVSYGNNTIDSNKFVNNTGRCIHSFNQTNTRITNNEFIDNNMQEVNVIRGGIIDNYEADMIIDNNEFTNDKTDGELRGGLLYHEIGTLDFTNNKVNISSIKEDPSSKAECSKGGVIFNRNATITISNNEFNNELIGNYSRGGVVYNNLGEITLKDNNFTNSIKGEHIRGIIVFNDVNSVLHIGNNSINSKLVGDCDPSEDKYFYNSDVPNEEGDGRMGITKYIETS